MDIHQNARTTPASRAELVARVLDDRLPVSLVATAAGVCPRTVRKWIARYQAEGPEGLADRSARPHRQPRATPTHIVARIRVTGNRRQCSPGAGWDYVDVCVDDHSRVGFVQIHPDETSHSVTAFLEAAVAYYRQLGVHVTGVMTDNGAGYGSRILRQRCTRLGLRHLYTRPYTPRTNGKAERFIQTGRREWAYARAYRTSRQRAAHLTPWLHRYNWHRPHGSLSHQPPISRLLLSRDNLLRYHI